MWQKNHRSNSPKRRRSNPCRTAGQGERRKASSPWPAVLQGQYMPMRHLVSRVAPTLHDRPATMSFPVLAADAGLHALLKSPVTSTQQLVQLINPKISVLPSPVAEVRLTAARSLDPSEINPILNRLTLTDNYGFRQRLKPM